MRERGKERERERERERNAKTRRNRKCEKYIICTTNFDTQNLFLNGNSLQLFIMILKV
jgi:hypothetical protein